jgi:hypothetical protein
LKHSIAPHRPAHSDRIFISRTLSLSGISASSAVYLTGTYALFTFCAKCLKRLVAGERYRLSPHQPNLRYLIPSFA